ncbi:hypothetical protein SS1G_05679 [Paecilomyces variotii No. 5]|uniref:FAD-binding domain-containing protein n=1 Tax=Byssochlamys spectabilis (strain No. 5 / NBRC 109023) TaxID=1356009 RepID=V5FL51_BYSSN|nr:hypothetical protein SS1G_05679 [Paecilomyces variotii No. 5]
MSSPSPRILIIGAGIAGLALAQGLRRWGISFTVFERDILSEPKRQNHRLKVAGPMQAKLRDLLTDEAWEEFVNNVAETTLGETTANAIDGSVLACRKGRIQKGTAIPWTVERNLLRRAMMRGIEEEIQFGKRFVRFEICEDHDDNHNHEDDKKEKERRKGDVVAAYFHDGSIEYGTLLVGADGARSNVRKQFLPDFKPVDTETCCIYGKTWLSQELLARFPPQYRKWLTVIQDRTPLFHSTISGEAPIALICEPILFFSLERGVVRPGSIHWCLVFPQDSSGLGPAELNEALGSLSAELAMEMTSEWHVSVRALVELQDPALTVGMRIYSANPNLEEWTPSSRVTVMGDAIHIMSPCGGVGAVAALNDAHALMKTISEEGISEASIGKYEEKMREFAKFCIRRSYEVGGKMVAVPDFEKCIKVDL